MRLWLELHNKIELGSKLRGKLKGFIILLRRRNHIFSLIKSFNINTVTSYSIDNNSGSTK